MSEERVQSAEMARDKAQAELANYKRQTQNVGELMEKCEENASLRAEFELAKKMILSSQEQLRAEAAKHEKELAKAKDERRMEADVAQGLRTELANRDKAAQSLQAALKTLTARNQELQHEQLGLQEQVKSFELLSSGETTGLLHLLFVELSGCTSDLDKLVTSCCDIYEQKQVDMVSLLGFDHCDYANAELASGITQAAGLINKEYITRRTKEILELRKRLGAIRKVVMDKYADTIAMNMSCATQ